MSTGGESAQVQAGEREEELRDRIRSKSYEELLESLLNETDWDDEIEMATGSRMSGEAHENRTILELIQNARDAVREGRTDDPDGERTGSVAVVVGPERLYVANTGQPFRLDENEILKRVRRLGEGKDDGETIGEMGVGMRSIMTLGERFGIHSSMTGNPDDGYTSVDFTPAHPWAMVTRRYLDILRNETGHSRIATQLEDEATVDACIEGLKKMAEGLDARAPDHTVLEEHDEWPGVEDIIDRVYEKKDPPSPEAVVDDLPDLSPFKHPTIRRETDSDEILNTLLGRGGEDAQTNEPLADSLPTDAYTTVVTVDYRDDAQTCLHDLYAEAFKSEEGSLDVSTDGSRDRLETEVDRDSRRDRVWSECEETITDEVLVLLGEIERLDLVLVGDGQTDEIEESHRYTVEPAGNRPGADGPETRRVTVEYEDGASGDDPVSTYHVFTRSWDSDLVDEDEDDRLKILYEEPRPDGQWSPEPHPLYLYYPIEDEQTPFPFVVHAPFEVQMNRQQLDRESDRNEALLAEDGELCEFVLDTVAEIVDSESALRRWLPWLVMPMADERDRFRDERPTPRFVGGVIEELSETACVPTFGDGETTPDEILLELPGPSLDAFEPIRTYLERTGESEHGWLPAATVVGHGEQWLKTADEAGVLQEDRARAAGRRIGLTELLEISEDPDPDDPDLVSVLVDVWGADTDTVDPAVEVEDARAAETYFETVIDRLPDEGSPSARRLGEGHVPLLPALDGTDAVSGETIRYLVRTNNSRSTTGPGSDRTVFRKDSRESKERGEIDPPPSWLDVFVVPYRAKWHGVLEDNAETWGTTKFGGDTDIYRRVAAVLGGYRGRDVEGPDGEFDGLDYLYDCYVELNENEETTLSEFLHPIPFQGCHYHTTFTDSVETSGIGDLLQGEKLNAVNDDNFLQQLHTGKIQVATRDGMPADADRVVFGKAWSEVFEEVAAWLETDDDGSELSDPGETRHEDDDDKQDSHDWSIPGETTLADDYRRWGAAVELAASVREETGKDDVPTLAPPQEVWDHLQSPADGDGPPDPSDGSTWFWPLNFLLHLGVQVGPHVEWAWLNPNSETRRPRALSVEECREFSKGKLPDTDLDELPLRPDTDDLEQYAEVCRQARNHPAFVVGHSNNCRDDSRAAHDDWCVYDAVSFENRVAIPMWWQFTTLPRDFSSETAKEFRTAVLLLWPELSTRLFRTCWACAGGFRSHQVNSPNDWIPALGLVQLRRASLWPVEDDAEESSEPARAMDLLNARDHPAQPDHERLRKFPESADVSGRVPELESVAPERELDTFLATSLDELGPAAAAERLDRLVERSDRQPKALFESVGYQLLRKATADDLGVFEPLDDETERVWKRRDIYHTGTRVLVNDSGEHDDCRIGRRTSTGVGGEDRAEAKIFGERIPSFARDQLENRGDRFVELPSSRGNIVGTLRDESGDEVEFGIEGEQDKPSRPTVPAGIDGDDVDEELRRQLKRRVGDLAAAYVVATGDDRENVEATERKIHRAVDHLCEVSRSDVEEAVDNLTSVKWERDETGDQYGIAFVREAVDDEFSPRHAVDALVDIVDNEGVKDKFEIVLLDEPGGRYEETKRELGLGNVERNRLTRLLTDRLPSIATGIAESLYDLDRVPEYDDFGDLVPDENENGNDEEVKRVLEELRDFAIGEGRGEIIVPSLVSRLTDEGILDRGQAEACLRAAVEFEVFDDRDALRTLSGVLAEEGADVADRGQDVLADERIKWQDLGDRRVGDYLAAAALAEEFYEGLETDGTEGTVRKTAREVVSMDDLSPSPLDPIRALPHEVYERLGVENPSLPVCLLGNADAPDDRPGEVGFPIEAIGLEDLADTYADWCEERHDRKDDAVDASLDEWALYECLTGATLADARSRVIATLKPEDGRGDRHTIRDRRRKEREFDSGETRYGEIEQTSGADAADADLPEVGSGGGTDGQTSTVPAADGRAGELNCIEAAWRQFQAAGEKQRPIVEAVVAWRDSCGDTEQWRLNSTADVFDDEAAFADGSGRFSEERLYDRLCDDGDEEERRRKWFRMLVDTSEESGPGFDHIDPFGTHYGDEVTAESWEASWMRRVEVKSLCGDPDGGYRVELTGNEFRMSRRSCDACGDDRRYLVRVVFGSRDGGEFEPKEWRDVDDVQEAFASDQGAAASRGWEALRGGRVPMSGTFD